jgi:hypothetical protein
MMSSAAVKRVQSQVQSVAEKMQLCGASTLPTCCRSFKNPKEQIQPQTFLIEIFRRGRKSVPSISMSSESICNVTRSEARVVKSSKTLPVSDRRVYAVENFSLFEHEAERYFLVFGHPVNGRKDIWLKFFPIALESVLDP